MDSSSLDAALLNEYIWQHELQVLVNQLGVAADQIDENLLLLRSDQLNGNRRKVQLNSSSIRSRKLAARLLFHVTAADTVPRRAGRASSLRYLDPTSMHSATTTQTSWMWKSHLDGLTLPVSESDLSTKESCLLREVVRVVVLRCRDLLMGSNIPCVDGTLRWVGQVQTSPRLGAALAFTVVTAWRNIASIAVGYASMRVEHPHASSLAETITSDDQVVEACEVGCADETLFFCALCSPSKPSNMLAKLLRKPINDLENNHSTNDVEASFDLGLLREFALVVFRSYCHDVPLDMWNDFLSTTQFVAHLLTEIKNRQAKSLEDFAHLPTTLTQEAIVLRSLLIFSTGQTHAWALAFSKSLQNTVDMLDTCGIEHVLEDVYLDIRNIYYSLKKLIDKDEMKNSQFILFSALVLSDRYALWLLQPYLTMWSCYCTLSGAEK